MKKCSKLRGEHKEVAYAADIYAYGNNRSDKFDYLYDGELENGLLSKNGLKRVNKLEKELKLEEARQTWN